jgi:endonuclease/exonuclease/phosphatase (EEP) superfamily protein YafD
VRRTTTPVHRPTLLGITLVLALACARPPAERPRAPTGAAFRLLTYNVNYGIAGDDETIAAIRDADADLVLLQETNAAWEQALRGSLSGRWPKMIFKHRGGAGGLAVLSRLPIVEAEFFAPVGEGWFPAARVVVETAFGRVQALSVHLRPPVSDGGSFVSGAFTTPAVRFDEIQTFFSRLAPGYPTLIAGDFNEEEDGHAVRFLAGKGMISALARYAPGEPTWRWPMPIGTLHKQLDHVLYDARLDVASAEIRQRGRSDHLPIVAVFTPGRSR